MKKIEKLIGGTLIAGVGVIGVTQIDNVSLEAKAITKDTISITSDTSALKTIESSKIRANYSVSNAKLGIYLMANGSSLGGVFHGGDKGNISVYTNSTYGSPTSSSTNTFSGLSLVSTSIVNNVITQVRTDGVFDYTLRISIINATLTGAYVKVEMSAYNKTTTTQNTAFSFNNDLNILGNDSATIKFIENGWEAYNAGNTAKVTAYYDGVFNTTPADGIYVGSYSSQVAIAPSAHSKADIVNVDTGSGFFYASKPVSAGQTRKESFIIGVGLPNKAPTLSLTNGSTTVDKGQPLTISGTSNDADVGDNVDIMYSIDDGTEQKLTSYVSTGTSKSVTGNLTIPTSLSNGSHTIKVWALDENGGTSSVQSIPITVKNVNTPVIESNIASTTSTTITASNLDTLSADGHTFYLVNKETGVESQITNQSVLNSSATAGKIQFTVSGLNAGEIYKYAVKAKNKYSVASSESSISTVTTLLNNISPTITQDFTGTKYSYDYVDDLNSSLVTYKTNIETTTGTVLNTQNNTKSGTTTSYNYKGSKLDDGTYNLVIYGIKEDGTAQKVYTTPVLVDNTGIALASATYSKTSPTNQDVVVGFNYPTTEAGMVIKVKEGLNGSWSTINVGDTLTVSDNVDIYMQITDNHNNVTEGLVASVTNIDKIPPNTPTAISDKTTPTNVDVKVTPTFSSDSTIKEYRINGGDWTTYTSDVVMSDNGTVEFRGQDSAGNYSNIYTHTVSNIDKVKPTAPKFSANPNTITNKDVTLTINYASDTVVRLYKINDGAWLNYTEPLIIPANALIYTRSADEAGNYSDGANYNVNFIDKIAPDKPTVSANVTAPTNTSVTVTPVYSSDTVVKQYRVDNGSWTTYTTPVIVDKNSVVEFRGYDNATNVSDIATYNVTNIDKIAPDKPTVSADITTPTNQDVTITPVYSNDTAIKEYRIDNGDWSNYTTPVTVDKNSVVEFRGYDNASNVSDITTYTVTNIDKIAPDTPISSANKTTPTNKDVIITSIFSEDSIIREYRINEGLWESYVSPITISENGFIEFRGWDNAGNVSLTSRYDVTNIDKIPPNNPTVTANITAPTNQNVIVTPIYSSDSVIKEYRVDNGDWVTYNAPITVTENEKLEFRGQDDAGNYSSITTYVVDNIDKIPPENPVTYQNIYTPINTDILVSSVFSSDTVIKEYRINNGEWIPYLVPVNVGENLKLEFRGKDIAGNYSDIVTHLVTNIDKILPDIPTVIADKTEPTNKPVTITPTYSNDSVVKKYRIDNGDWLDYTVPIVVDKNSVLEFYGIDDAGNNSLKASYTVSNIDTTAPLTPTININPESITNQPVTVFLNYTEDSVVKKYRIDSGDWLDYTEPIVVDKNSKIEFYGVDNADNSSTIGEYFVSNIDTESPDSPTVLADITAPTNKPVTITPTYSDDSVIKKYRIDGGDWLDYTVPIIVDKNSVLEFYSKDNANNASEITVYSVLNIDLEPPTEPKITVDKTTPTNQDVLVKADYSDDSVVKKYRINNGEWLDYTTGIIVEENSDLEFYGIDDANNNSSISKISITNIDKTPPNTPTAISDIVIPTNTDVIVTPEYSSDTVIKEYRINGEEWLGYVNPIIIKENSIIEFRGYDNANNVSEIYKHLVTNIDKTNPDSPKVKADIIDSTNKPVTITANYTEDSIVKLYKIDNGEWLNYIDPVKVDKNSDVYFKGIDIAKNESEITRYSVTNIDLDNPETPTFKVDKTEPTNTDVRLTINYPEDAHKKLYKIDDGDWQGYTGTITVAKNSKITAKAIDIATNESEENSYEIKNIDKVAPETPSIKSLNPEITNENVDVVINYPEDSYKKFYRLNGGDWVEYEDKLSIESNKKIEARALDIAGNYSEISTYRVSNIKKEIPDSPEFSVIKGIVSNPYNQDVTVQIDYSEDSSLKYYKFNADDDWLEYKEALVIKENTKIFAKGVDTAKNSSDISTFTISNIDKTPPKAPEFIYSDKQTNQNLFITLKESEDNLVTYYREKGTQDWIRYDGEFGIDKNTDLEAMSLDKATNQSEITSVSIKNIDKENPNQPIINLNKITPTNSSILATIKAPENKPESTLYYRLDTTSEWLKYTKPIIIENNLTIYAKAVDNVNNESEISYQEIRNIDKEKPTIIGNLIKNSYGNKGDLIITVKDNNSIKSIKLLDGVKSYEDFNNAGEVINNNHKIKIMGNTKYTVLAEDSVGNLTLQVIDISDLNSAPDDTLVFTQNILENTNKDVLVTISKNSVDTTSPIYYRIVGQDTWALYQNPILVNKNSKIEAKTYNTISEKDFSGSYSVENIDKTAPTLNLSINSSDKTRDSVTINISAKDDVGVSEIRYLKGSKGVSSYDSATNTGNSFEVSENGLYTVFVKDSAGNITVSRIKVDNIVDTEVPKIEIPLDIDISEVIQDYKIKLDKLINKNDGLVVKGSLIYDKNNVEYKPYIKLGKNGDWILYTEDTVLPPNTIIYLKLIDEFGVEGKSIKFKTPNLSGIVNNEKEPDNIDKEPTLDIDNSKDANKDSTSNNADNNSVTNDSQGSSNKDTVETGIDSMNVNTKDEYEFGTDNSKSENEELPKTGFESNTTTGLGLSALLSALALSLFRRKKK